MTRVIGTTARGVRGPVVKQGDNLIKIVADSVMNAVKETNCPLKERDVIAITESILARSQGNYINVDHISRDINQKFNDSFGVVFPIQSRNRFSIILKGLARTEKKITVLFRYPSDEVGNPIMDEYTMIEKKINPYTDVLTETDYRNLFGYPVKHPFTGVDYLELYKELAVNDNIQVVFSNNPLTILEYTKDVLVASVHDRKRIVDLLKQSGADKVYALSDVMTSPINGSGYNPDFGLLGSNMASATDLKLFPRDAQSFVEKVQEEIKRQSGITVEVMVYGDGAFKDPVGHIWELADPVVSPGFTSGLNGMPNEIKIKYLADTDLKNYSGSELQEKMKEIIRSKNQNLVGQDASLGTTPRRITDLLGSLCDLVSGSGDKGTPFIWISGYFDNYATE
ncbi:hypothetical protein HMPREF1987_02201 [Peptostreptococcaceae bacterium oral taxon 113 str. W5053]|nr:hypothetical protein HMPREF1987_02201 [Peptostreptococcaceae bacterium oral taxon 113 str. W5053]